MIKTHRMQQYGHYRQYQKMSGILMISAWALRW